MARPASRVTWVRPCQPPSPWPALHRGRRSPRPPHLPEPATPSPRRQGARCTRAATLRRSGAADGRRFGGVGTPPSSRYTAGVWFTILVTQRFTNPVDSLDRLHRVVPRRRRLRGSYTARSRGWLIKLLLMSAPRWGTTSPTAQTAAPIVRNRRRRKGDEQMGLVGARVPGSAKAWMSHEDRKPYSRGRRRHTDVSLRPPSALLSSPLALSMVAASPQRVSGGTGWAMPAWAPALTGLLDRGRERSSRGR